MATDVYGQGLGLASLQNQYPERAPTPSEQQFFGGNPTVAGYAAPDKSVVLNPSFKGEKESVLTNERFRQLFADYPQMVPANMTVLQHQIPSQSYANDPQALASTVLARLLSGDPSASPYTWQQQEAALTILNFLRDLYAGQNLYGY